MAESGFKQLPFHILLKERGQAAATIDDAKQVIRSSIDHARSLGYRIAFLSGSVTPQGTETRQSNLGELAHQSQELADFLQGAGILVFSCDVLNDLIGRVEDREDAYRFWNSIVRGDNENPGVDMLIIARNAQRSRGVLEEVVVARERGIPIVTINEIVGRI